MKKLQMKGVSFITWQNYFYGVQVNQYTISSTWEGRVLDIEYQYSSFADIIILQIYVVYNIQKYTKINNSVLLLDFSIFSQLIFCE